MFPKVKDNKEWETPGLRGIDGIQIFADDEAAVVDPVTASRPPHF